MKITANATVTATESGSRQHLPPHPWATCGAHNVALIKLNGSTAGAGEDRPQYRLLVGHTEIMTIMVRHKFKARRQRRPRSSAILFIRIDIHKPYGHKALSPAANLPICLSRSPIGRDRWHYSWAHSHCYRRLVNQATFRCVTVTSH